MAKGFSRPDKVTALSGTLRVQRGPSFFFEVPLPKAKSKRKRGRLLFRQLRTPLQWRWRYHTARGAHTCRLNKGRLENSYCKAGVEVKVEKPFTHCFYIKISQLMSWLRHKRTRATESSRVCVYLVCLFVFVCWKVFDGDVVVAFQYHGGPGFSF